MTPSTACPVTRPAEPAGRLRTGGRTAVAALILLLLAAGCAETSEAVPSSPTPQPPLVAPQPLAAPQPLPAPPPSPVQQSFAPVQQADGTLAQPTGWKAVLISGDDSEPAFDNAVDALADKLETWGVGRGNIAELKASGRGASAATESAIDDAFARLKPTASEGCFVFITSHGAPRKGLVMRRADAMLTPRGLANLLDGPCSARATVVVTSGCFSGAFADARPMRAPNRTILTAARYDRPSFGCKANRHFTVFDECFLGSLERGLLWQSVMDRARACVEKSEAALGVEAPSQPQIAVGTDVAGIRVFPQRNG
jgi:hypothetical protein